MSISRITLKQVVLDQEESRKAIMPKCIQRHIPKDKLLHYLSAPNILVITGVRRCGKSILAHLLSVDKNIASINFDDERLIDFETKDFDLLLSVFHEIYGKNIDHFIFDEIQNISGWELFLNRIRQTHRCIITGSNAHLLSKELATHLTGRYSSFTLWPFSFAEFLDYHNSFPQKKLDLLTTKEQSILISKLGEYIAIGGFPESYIFGKESLRNLFSDIIDKDISQRHRISSDSIKKLARYLLSNIGCDNSFNQLSKIVNVKDPRTVSKYITYLSDAYLTIILEKYSNKLRSQILANKKIYSVDHGLSNSIGFTPTTNDSRVIENIVLLELLRLQSNYNEHKTEVFFSEDLHTRAKLDFLVRINNVNKVVIQVTSNIEDPNTRKRELRSFEVSHKELKQKKQLLITLDSSSESHIQLQSGVVNVVPLWRFLLEARNILDK